MRAAKPQPALCFVALVKGRERYVWAYRDGQQAELIRSMGRMASDSELSITWADVAVMSQKVRSQ